MKPPCALAFFRLHQDLTSGISIFLNTMLFLLIITRTSKDMRAFSMVMLYNCGLDFSFTVVTQIIDMRMDIRNGAMIVSFHGLIQNAPFAARYWLSTYQEFVLLFAITGVSVPSVYRYFLVCRNYKLQTHQWLLVILAANAIALLTPATIYVFFRPYAVRAQDDALFWDSMECADPSEFMFFKATTMSDYLVPIPSLISTMIGYSLSYAVIFGSAYSIWRKVKTSASMTKTTRSSHAQLNRVLIAQSLAPLLLMVGPMVAVTIVVLLRFDKLGWVLTVCTAALSWMPILNPLITVYFVESYRETVRHAIAKVLSRLPKCMRLELKPKLRKRAVTVSTLSSITIVTVM